jgi:hypothetical protein
MFIFSAFLILNYQVGDKYVFYLSLYIPLVIALGAGIGCALEWVYALLKTVPGRSFKGVYLLAVLFFATMVLEPVAGVRWQALKHGVAEFVIEDYVFPVYELEEPRFVADLRLTGIEENAVLIMDWRAMYATAYLAHVERGKTDMLFKEALPAGNDGEIASSLITQVQGYLQDGRPVYVEWKYPGLEEHFRLLPAFGNMYKLSFRK